MKLGKEALLALQAEVTGFLRPGDSLVVAGDIAIEGTLRLVREHFDMLTERFSRGFLEDSLKLGERFAAVPKGEAPKKSPVWQMAVRAGATALYALGEDGFSGGLWRMAEASGVGLTGDLRKVPIRQETIEICEIFDRNPYQLSSEGALLIGTGQGYVLAEQLKRAGVPASVIGEANASNDRLLVSGQKTRYLERPRPQKEKREEAFLWQS